jgi:hypothetical protein
VPYLSIRFESGGCRIGYVSIQTCALLAPDRFGHICRSAELASTGDEEGGENGTGNRLWKAALKLRFTGKSGCGTTDAEDLSI